MRILVVSQYFWPENFRINDLVCELVKRGHQITILTGKPNYPAGFFYEEFIKNPSDFQIFERCNIFRSPMLARGKGAISLVLNYISFALCASFFGIKKLKAHDFDVIFVFEPSPITVGIPAIILAKYKKIPIVFWVLDLWPDTLKAIGVVKSPFILRSVGYLVGYIYNNCTLVLGQSKGFLKNINIYCKDKHKIKYFPSWAEDVFSQHIISYAPEIEKQNDLFTIIFAGNIGEAQDMRSVLQAILELKNNKYIRWIIIGEGNKLSWLKTEVQNLELDKIVCLLGRYSVERMPSFFAHADALLVSLKDDPVFSITIPGKIQSYLLAGKPILGMLNGEGAAVIEQAKAGLTCHAGDYKSLAKNILQMMAMSSEEKGALGKNGFMFAKKEFDRDILISRLEGFFEEAVSISNK